MASRSNHNSLFACLRDAFFVAGLLLLISPLAQSQTKPNSSNQTPPPSSEPRTPKDEKSDPFHDFGSSPERDMRHRMILKEEKKQYDENLARAREASELAAELMKTYEATQSFNSVDTKKFEKLEKLTKRIRNEAGGSDTDPDLSDIPGVLETALKRVVDLAGDLRKLVEKTPRHVASLAVINQANKLLGLLQRVRFWR
jgi:hypothetical protein